LPGLKSFLTLWPVPGFAGWLARERKAEQSRALDGAARDTLQLLDTPDWHKPGASLDALREVLQAVAASCFLKARTPTGRPVDPVARFTSATGRGWSG
jgi:malonyl-CoA decarboxylase